MEYLAHTSNSVGEVDPLKSHLRLVAERASKYAEAFDASLEAYIAGILHDIGKYGDKFQQRLRGEIRGVDHWSNGAWIALSKYQMSGIAAALSIQGHHKGLQRASKSSLGDLDPAKLEINNTEGLVLSEPDMRNLLERLEKDGLELPAKEQIGKSIYKHSDDSKIAGMLDIRMLFSTLVDADYIETEAHFNAQEKGARSYSEPGLKLNPDTLLEHLLGYLGELSMKSGASPSVRKMRSDLLHACLAAAENKHGLFTLTAPTGTGKTLSMLAFAVKHALHNNLERIITVIPYLSIIDQTVSEYRKALASAIDARDARRYVLEHHSLSGIRGGKRAVDGVTSDDEQEFHQQERLLTENWDAPIIVTTSVQFLESLFSNRPSACRKLHRLANSVILFDEVQTLPIGLVIPTLATLSHLSERYNSTIVFSTATQPAFSHLDAHIRKHYVRGWNPREIVPEELKLYERARRNRARWPQDIRETVSWNDLAKELANDAHGQVLCIVNLKRHALTLYDELIRMGVEDVFHLSTNMCPAHRQEVIKEVRLRLDKGEPCLLVSTQCVEAGVDIDFPLVYRALGPLDSIAQAAGRCNRNGRLEEGEVVLFLPESTEGENIYPDGAYRQATEVMKILLAKYGDHGLDINSPRIFEEYYRELYDIARPERKKEDLLEGINLRDFVKVSESYHVIEKPAINILVPYEPAVFNELEEEVRKAGLNAKWITKARPYAVGLFKPGFDDPLLSYIEPVPLGRDSYSEEWFIYLNGEHYSLETGLNPPQGMECLIG
ncbi:MAG: CRISPR-associated helicase Cas3' [Actinobacteria bacterium]|nr:CRISPR-associated helicase Cas3' [Actinomycetota bacterium]